MDIVIFLHWSQRAFFDPRLWIYAFGQAFFSLSIAGNGTVIYGSYLSEEEDVVSSARNVAFFDTLAALLCGTRHYTGHGSGRRRTIVRRTGADVYLSAECFNGMPGGWCVEIVFYVCVLFAGLSSLVNLYEAPVEMMQERFGFRRKIAVAVIAMLGGIIS